MLLQLQSLIKACETLGIHYHFYDDHHNVIEVSASKQTLFFVNSGTSLNSDALSTIAGDKYFAYKILEGHIKMPKTYSYLDPFSGQEYQKYVVFHTYEDIFKDCLEKINLPCIVKKNRGNQGANVFLCRSEKDLDKAFHLVFDTKSKLYDYVALAQEYIEPLEEYRVTVFNKKVQFVYKKDIAGAQFTGNLSPLHWQDAHAVLVEDKKLLHRLAEFVKPVYENFPIMFAGLDVILGKDGELYLIEINSRPAFNYFISDSGEEEVIHMYTEILRHYS